MTKTDFCIKLFNYDSGAEVELTTNCGEVICGIVDEVRDDYVVVDETCAFGDMRIVSFGDIATVDIQEPGTER